MIHHKLILMCLLAIFHGNNTLICPIQNGYVHALADTIEYYSERDNISKDVMASIADHESQFDQYAISNKGALGLFQDLRNGAIQGNDLKLSNKQLMDINTNTKIASEYIKQIQEKCHHKAILWLSVYNAGGKCRVTAYSQNVLFNLRLLRKKSLNYFDSFDNQSNKSHMAANSERSDHTSYKQEGLPQTKVQDTHVHKSYKEKSKYLVKIADPIEIVAGKESGQSP